MKFTRTLFAFTLGLSAMPLSLALEFNSPVAKASEKRQCDGNVRAYHCTPFGHGKCGSIFYKPKPDKQDPLNFLEKIANTLLNTIVGIISFPENPLGLVGTLISLPSSFVNNGKTDTFKVDQDFLDKMAQNVRNYVAQELTHLEMKNLQNGITGNMYTFENTYGSYKYWLEHKDDLETEPVMRWDVERKLEATIGRFLDKYPSYESDTPWEHPLQAIDGTEGSVNGYGIYYSVFVTQMLVAFMQQIAFRDFNPVTTLETQSLVVEYAWKAIKHSQVLVDTIVKQRHNFIKGPTLVRDNNDLGDAHYQINDDWFDNGEKCYWTGNGSISYHLYENFQCDYRDCPQSVQDFVHTHSTSCAEARKQFVTGTLISNWNTWLIEPSKKWAALADLICKNSHDPKMRIQCKNQGEDTSAHYKDNGGTAVDYVTSTLFGGGTLVTTTTTTTNSMSSYHKTTDFFVLGTLNTDECPFGATHITDRTRCQEAYRSLSYWSLIDHTLIANKERSRTMLSNHVDYVYNWPKYRWPTGCFINRKDNGVYFNKARGGNNAGYGQPVCEKNKNDWIQQTCQRDHPGKAVVATPVSYCHLVGGNTVCGEEDPENCNYYYNSYDFIDFQPMGVYADWSGWTCCVSQPNSRSVQNYVLGTLNTDDCPYGTTHITDRTHCQAASNKLVKTHPEFVKLPPTDYSWPDGRWPHGCFFENDNNCIHFNHHKSGNKGGTGRPICEFPSYAVVQSQEFVPISVSLVGSSNEIPQDTHIPFSAIFGLFGLVMMVATYKVVKDYRGRQQHHHHSKHYNKLDYESLMED